MGIFQISLGIVWCAFAVWLFIVSHSKIALGINLFIGLALILFNNEENKLEQRKDINIQKNKN